MVYNNSSMECSVRKLLVFCIPSLRFWEKEGRNEIKKRGKNKGEEEEGSMKKKKRSMKKKKDEEKRWKTRRGISKVRNKERTGGNKKK